MLVLKGDNKNIEMKKEKPKKAATPTIDANAKATKELAEAIKHLANREPDSRADLLDAIVKLHETQQALIEKLGYEKAERVTNWEFSVSRDRKGAIEKIIARGE